MSNMAVLFQSYENTVKTVQSTVALHNWLKDRQEEEADEEDEDALQPQDDGEGIAELNPEEMRDNLAEYFMSEEGEFVPQWGIVNRTSRT